MIFQGNVCFNKKIKRYSTQIEIWVYYITVSLHMQKASPIEKRANFIKPYLSIMVQVEKMIYANAMLLKVYKTTFEIYDR